MLLGMWDHPGPWLEPMSPTLAGGFLTTGPPWKSQHWIFVCYQGEKEKKKDCLDIIYNAYKYYVDHPALFRLRNT